MRQTLAKALHREAEKKTVGEPEAHTKRFYRGVKKYYNRNRRYGSAKPKQKISARQRRRERVAMTFISSKD